MLYDADNKVIAETVSHADIAKGFQSMEGTLKKSGRHGHGGGFGSFPTIFPHPAVHGRLGFPILRHLYETSSAVRPAVDGITREISSLPWMVGHEDGKWHPNDDAKQMEKFLKKVNFDDESIGTILGKFLNDYLVLGRGVIEKARNPFGKIIEIYARDASLFQVIPSVDGTSILAYRERRRNSMEILNTHSKGDIIYRQYAPITYTHMSMPIIETIVNEISLLLLSTKNIAWSFVNDEIPPGVLHLGEIGAEALERAKLSFEVSKGIAQASTGMRVIDNVDKVDWITFQRPFREMQVAELLPIFERIISRNFGLASIEAGLTGGGGRGSSEVALKASQSKMIVPLTVITSDIVTGDIIAERNSKLEFIYSTRPGESTQEKSDQLLSQQNNGVISRNEARASLGRRPVKGGDLFTVKLGNEVVPFDEDTGEPIFRNPIPGAPTPSDIARQTREGDPPTPSDTARQTREGDPPAASRTPANTSAIPPVAIPKSVDAENMVLVDEFDDTDMGMIVPQGSLQAEGAEYLEPFSEDPIADALKNFRISEDRFNDIFKNDVSSEDFEDEED